MQASCSSDDEEFTVIVGYKVEQISIWVLKIQREAASASCCVGKYMPAAHLHVPEDCNQCLLFYLIQLTIRLAVV